MASGQDIFIRIAVILEEGAKVINEQNESLASAMLIMKNLDAAFTNELDLSKRSPMFVRAVKLAREWVIEHSN